MTDQQLFWLLAFILFVLILAGRRRHSRYIPKKSKDLAWAKFVQDFYRKNPGKTPRRKDYEFDHKYPHSKGGSSDPDNIQVLSKKANRKKGAKLPWQS